VSDTLRRLFAGFSILLVALVTTGAARQAHEAVAHHASDPITLSHAHAHAADADHDPTEGGACEDHAKTTPQNPDDHGREGCAPCKALAYLAKSFVHELLASALLQCGDANVRASLPSVSVARPAPVIDALASRGPPRV